MQIHGTATPDSSGRLTFTGHPHEIQEGDILFAAGNEYAVRDKPKSSNNFGKPATELVLCDPGEYAFEVPRGGEPPAYARISLGSGMTVRFSRTVLVDELDFGEEDQLFYELVWCEDPFDDFDADLAPVTTAEDEDDPHAHHSEYNREWRGKCRVAPTGMLVGINLEPEGKNADGQCKIVDTVFPNGAVVFTDGTSFQSHPDKEWIGWLKD
jgi:hypothetical protein